MKKEDKALKYFNDGYACSQAIVLAFASDFKLNEELAKKIKYEPPKKGWLDPTVEFKQGVYNYSGIPKNVEYLQLPNPRKWQPEDPDWQLPENWQQATDPAALEKIAAQLNDFIEP